MTTDTGIDFVNTRGPIFYCEIPKSKSDRDYYQGKSKEMKFKKLSQETFHEDVARAIAESSWKPFAAQIASKFRALVSHEGYSMDWRAYCCDVIAYLEQTYP